MITFRDFIIFLAENKCLGLYWSNYEKSNFADDYHSAGMAIRLVFECCPRLWLLMSFDWARSAEGFAYWDRLDTLWQMRFNYLFKQLN